MKIGTKSLLFGAHNIIIHPVLVFIAWWRLYGFPFDPRLWIAFLVHDWGYFGKSDMDGSEGETHVELGARIMRIAGKSSHGITPDTTPGGTAFNPRSCAMPTNWRYAVSGRGFTCSGLGSPVSFASIWRFPRLAENIVARNT